MTRRAVVASLWLLGLGLLPATAARGQVASPLIPIGGPELQGGLRIAAGYLPRGVTAEPAASVPDAAGVIHLQLDVDAVRGNPYGFEPDDSVPYLRVPFTLVHEGSGRKLEGVLGPMVSRLGFHYGGNIALAGAGAYTLTVEIRPPDGLVRHTDPRTGVGAWWSPFTLTWTFRYPPE